MEHRKQWRINWKGVAAFTTLLALAAMFGLYEEYSHSEFMRAWVAHHTTVVLFAAIYGGFTIAGIVASGLARRDITEVNQKNEIDQES